MDLISRKPAIDALDKQIKQCCKALGSLSLSDIDKHAVEVEMASLSAYRGILENLPTVQPEPQWIPVEKELPEPRIDVWVNSDLGQMVGYYDEMVNLWYGRDYLELIVNAWMPLPEAYKPNK